jgi:adenosylmethionine-8-amino-7-oxononanoate aminotransferase
VAERSLITSSETNVFPRELDRAYPLIVKARGVHLWDAAGNEYLDAISGGAMVTSLGHGLDELVDVAADQAREVSYLYSQQFTSPPQEELATQLCELAPPEFTRVHFTAGGAEANETALRLARSYHVERGEPERWRIISPAQAYHGPTIATLSLTGRPSLARPFDPYAAEHLHIPPSTWRFDPSGEAALAALDDVLERVGAETVAAFFCEPVSAASLPAYSPPEAFWRGLETRRREHGFLICLDEVVTGLGRTGTWFAASQLPLEPDVIATSKGLGAGYVPIGAMLCTEAVYATVAEGSRAFELGHTWGGAPLQCAVALAVVDYLRVHGLVERVAERSPSLCGQLREALRGSDLVREVRGRGFLFGIDYVDPRDGESFLEPGLSVARRIDMEALDRGLLVYSTQSTADGYTGDQTLLAPAFTSTDEELAEMVKRMTEVVRAVERQVKNQIVAGAASG